MIEAQAFLGGKVQLYPGDCRDVLRGLPDACIDSVVTDPPYALVSIGKRFGKLGSAEVKVPEGGSGAYARASAGFMGKQWDTGETAFAVEFWAEVLRVLKPGGHVVAFAGTRTYHRLACAIEDAGFEIRDQIAWTYGSGFPKSHNQPGGWGTALKPAWEPIVLARKPLIGTVAENILAHGTGALNIDGCRIPTTDSLGGGDQSSAIKHIAEGWNRPWMHDEEAKAAHSERVNANVARAEKLGRWPANIVHDGSDEVLAAFPDRDGAGSNGRKGVDGACFGHYGAVAQTLGRGDSGSAARFFYSAKAGKTDRAGSKHPTVKPVSLMRWLCRMVTPPGGVVLDPFAGSGTTGEAAWREGFSAVLVEREAEYQADIASRLSAVACEPLKSERTLFDVLS